MRRSYSRLCLKERWTFFVICLLLGCTAIGMAGYSFIKVNNLITAISMLLALVFLTCSGYIFFMNKRRKEIKREYSNEFDRELFSKQRTCPKCGASIGSNVCYCSKCGTKFH